MALLDNPMSDEPSKKMRAYLAEIYRLSEKKSSPDTFIATSELAEVLFVTAPAVNRMVNRLKEQGLLEHEPYRGIRLTPAGQKEALLQLRNHRIIEAFLVNVMGFQWDEVFDEALNMSQTLSPELAQRMLEMAGNPRYCPHGEPIPSPEGQLEDMHDINLAEVEAGRKGVITRCITREVDRLQYMAALGLYPGTECQILHIAPFNGPIQIKVGNEYRIIGHTLAESMRIRLED
ncbi:metal-dependent transcriptional regulator [Anaerolineales bacterium]